MASLAAALVEAQKKMPAVHKTGTSHHGAYATLDEIIEKTRPVLSEAGLAISQFPSETSTGGPGLKTVLLHAESGESIEATVPLLLNGKHDMQALGGAITYARRYGWSAVLGIANDDDDDGNRASTPAPRSGATQSSSPADGGQKGAGASAATPAPATSTFVPPEGAGATMSPGFVFASGKHSGKTIAEVQSEAPSYLTWVLEKSNMAPTTKDAVREFLNLEDIEQFADLVPDSDIPFDRTIDGLGG